MYDIVVIGAGPAGYVCAIKAAKLGAKVAIVEKAEFGGTCLNRGCIPTKDFLKNVELIKNIKKAKSRGVLVENDAYEIDMGKIVAHKNKTVKTLTGGVNLLLKHNGVEIYQGEAKLLFGNEVLIKSGEKEEKIFGKKIVLATGSCVRELPVEGMDSKFVFTSDSILDIDRVPKKMVIIGAGVIGCEFSQIFANFGSEVTVVELEDRVLPMADEQISSALMKVLKKDGVKFIFSKSLSKILDKGDVCHVILDDESVLECDAVLISIGRKSNLDAVKDLGLELERGYIKTDEYLRTSLANVFAIGDVNGLKMLAHAAFMMGEIAAHNAVFEEDLKKCDLSYTPSVVYTVPEVAFIGEVQKEERPEVQTGSFSFLANGRALACDEKVGFIKVLIDKRYKEILGVHMIGPSVSEIINEVSVIMQNELTVDEVLNSIHSHPSFSEVLYEAMADTLKMAIHK